MTDPTRPSTGTFQRQDDGRWRSVIRIFAVVGALLGLALIGNEIIENIACPDGMVECSKIHLSTFFVGLSMFGLCLLILQRGDVSLSFQQAASTGSIIRSWFTRAGRSTDAPGTSVDTVVSSPPVGSPQPTPTRAVAPGPPDPPRHNSRDVA